MARVILLLVLLGVPVLGWADPIQRGVLFNIRQTSAADATNVVTIGAQANTRAHVYRVKWSCSAGSAGLTLESPAGTVKWTASAAASGDVEFATGWTSETNTAVSITIDSCGAGNTSTVEVQADRY